MKPTLGLSTYQWNNNIKSMFLLAAFPCLLIAVVALFFAIVGYFSMDPSGHVNGLALGASTSQLPQTLWDYTYDLTLRATPYILMVAAAWIVIGTLLNEQLIRMATNAKPIDRNTYKELYNTLENLCISRGIKMPKFFMIDAPMLNAYASGLNENSFAVTVTKGLVEKLNKEEVRAVLAHELSHIINRDVRLLIVTVLFGGMLAFFAEMAWRNMHYVHMNSRVNRGNKGSGSLLLIAAIVLSVGYLISMFFRFALSRRREYLADAGAVELTKRPEAMISALQKISGHANMPTIPSGVQAMLIENPPHFFGLFATHPPIEARIAVLRQLGGIHTPKEGDSIIPKVG